MCCVRFYNEENKWNVIGIMLILERLSFTWRGADFGHEWAKKKNGGKNAKKIEDKIGSKSGTTKK